MLTLYGSRRVEQPRLPGFEEQRFDLTKKMLGTLGELTTWQLERLELPG